MFGLPMLWICAGVAAVVLALSGAVYVQTARLDSCKTEYAAFVAQVKAAGDAQEAASKLIDAENKTRMEKANADRAKKTRDLDLLYAEYQRLRDAKDSSGRPMSGAPTFAASADRTCFDSQELVGSIRGLEAGILKILQQGDQAIVDLVSAKEWAKGLK